MRFSSSGMRVSLPKTGFMSLLSAEENWSGLLQMVQGVGEVIVRGEQAPRFDFHAPLLSLPLVFQSTPAKVPDMCPIFMWKMIFDGNGLKTLRELPRGRRIGVAWAGNPNNSADSRRSIPAEHILKALTGTKGVLVSLQKGG